MLGLPREGGSHYVPPQVKAGQGGSRHVADYMFTEVPEGDPAHGPIGTALGAMDANGVAVAMLSLTEPHSAEAAAAHPDRFVLSTHVDPGAGVMEAVRRIRGDHAARGIRAVTMFPAGGQPAVGIGEAAAYAVYATCVELGLPVFVTCGVPGPRVPLGPQEVERLDRVCYDFPELVVVMRHGAEPWEDLAVKLMLKWPNLYYSMSAFSPKHYPDAIVDYANTRGAGKVLYGGYYPYALDLTRIFDELAAVGFREEVWPRFLRTNAASILGV
ncbi:MAG: amidohydrolase family protein [Acidimicrobiales bacterium]|nr:amidohydrolase family protein [Acidimicrobiales bacterium]